MIFQMNVVNSDLFSWKWTDYFEKFVELEIVMTKTWNQMMNRKKLELQKILDFEEQ